MEHDRNRRLASTALFLAHSLQSIIQGHIPRWNFTWNWKLLLFSPLLMSYCFANFFLHLSFAFFLFSFPQQEPSSLLLQLQSLLNQHSLFQAGNWSWSSSQAWNWSWSRSWARNWSWSFSRACQKTFTTFLAILIHFLQKKTSWSCAWSYWSFQRGSVIPWSKVS